VHLISDKRLNQWCMPCYVYLSLKQDMNVMIYAVLYFTKENTRRQQCTLLDELRVYEKKHGNVNVPRGHKKSIHRLVTGFMI